MAVINKARRTVALSAHGPVVRRLEPQAAWELAGARGADDCIAGVR